MEGINQLTQVVIVTSHTCNHSSTQEKKITVKDNTRAGEMFMCFLHKLEFRSIKSQTWQPTPIVLRDRDRRTTKAH